MRVVSLSPAATEVLFALGRGEWIVCTDQFSNFPEGAKGLPHLLGHQEVEVEELRKFAPDLILTGTWVQAKLAENLKAAGLPVVHQDPRTIAAIYESTRALGMLVEAQKEAEAVVLRMQQGFNEVKRKGVLLPRRPRVYVEEWPALPGSSGKHNPPFASGNWVPEVVRMAGGESLPFKSGALSREVTLEEVSGFHPDLIVVSWCGAGMLAPKELLLKRPGWDRVSAILQRHVRVIDDSLLNRPGPRLVEGAQRLFGWLFELLH